MKGINIKSHGLKVGDGIVSLVSVLVLISSVKFSVGAGGAPIIEIESRDGRYLYPLNIDQQFSVPGPQGECLVEIRQDELRIIDSDCPDKICQTLTPLNQIGDWTACLPNGVMISLVGKDSSQQSMPDSLAF